MDTRRTFIGQLVAAVAAFFARLNPNRVLAETPTDPIDAKLEVFRKNLTERERILKETAAKVVDWMRLIGYQGRYHAVIADFNRLFRDQAPRLVHPEARVFVGSDVWAPISLAEFIELWELADASPDDKAVRILFQDLFVAMMRHFKIGKPVTNDNVEPGINHPIRYVGAKYVKDVDLLRDRENSQQLAYLLGCMLQDVLAVPERETADWLELQMFVRREAFMFECFTYTTHLVPTAIMRVQTHDAGSYDFLGSRLSVRCRLDYFEQVYGRKPRVIFVNTVDIKEYCKWSAIWAKSGPRIMNYPGLVAAAFEAEFGIKLQLFDYVPDGDNDARLIG